MPILLIIFTRPIYSPPMLKINMSNEDAKKERPKLHYSILKQVICYSNSKDTIHNMQYNSIIQYIRLVNNVHLNIEDDLCHLETPKKKG